MPSDVRYVLFARSTHAAYLLTYVGTACSGKLTKMILCDETQLSFSFRFLALVP